MNSHGTIVICLCFSPKGKVSDMRILSGPAMLQQSVLDSVKDWTFFTVVQGGRRYGGCGTLRIHVDMVNSNVNSTIEE
jgi:outer membrane biosynthesis protein TonB